MTTIKYVHRGRSLRSAALLLAVAGTGYAAGALLHNTVTPRDVSAVFARAVQAAESNPRESLPASGAFAPGVDWGRSDIDRIEAPRECDATRGVTTACIFMD